VRSVDAISMTGAELLFEVKSSKKATRARVVP